MTSPEWAAVPAAHSNATSDRTRGRSSHWSVGRFTREKGFMATPTRYEVQYADLFEALTLEERASVSAALADDRLEGGDIRRDQVELLVRSVTESLSDSDYLDAVLALIASRRVDAHR